MVGVESRSGLRPDHLVRRRRHHGEVLRDFAVAIPPLNRVLATRLIARTRVARLLGPFRNMPAIDSTAVEDLLLRLSDLVCELPQVVELDINPLFASESEVLAVDARIAISASEGELAPYAHMAITPTRNLATCSSWPTAPRSPSARSGRRTPRSSRPSCAACRRRRAISDSCMRSRN